MKTVLVPGCVLGGILVAFAMFVLFLFLIKVLWAWTVPDLFPRAVEEGYVAARVSWAAAAKLALLVAVLSGVAGGRSGAVKRAS